MRVIMLYMPADAGTAEGALVDLDKIPSDIAKRLWEHKGQYLEDPSIYGIWNEAAVGWVALPFTGTVEKSISLAEG